MENNDGVYREMEDMIIFIDCREISVNSLLLKAHKSELKYYDFDENDDSEKRTEKMLKKRKTIENNIRNCDCVLCASARNDSRLPSPNKRIRLTSE